MADRRTPLAVACGLLLTASLGCQTVTGSLASLPRPSLPRPSLPKVSNPLAGLSNPLAPSVEGDSPYVEVAEYDPTKRKGLLNKVLPEGIVGDGDSLYRTRATPPGATRRLESAKRLLADGDHGKAAREFEKLRKEFYRTAIEEEAMFLTAEAHFAAGKFPKAQDGYDALFERFPSTRYADDATGRLYEIARHWVGAAEPITATDIATVGFERPQLMTTSPGPSKGLSPSRRLPFVPNLFDGSRPLFDTTGRGLQALRSIWLNDPNGDLADDALMAVASHYVREGNDVEAGRYLKIIRDDYPESPYLEDAFVVGGHVKQVSYQGVQYDATSLEEAARLKKQALRLFPETADRARLLREIDEASKQSAARQWAQVEYYQRKRLPRSVAVAAHALLTDFPTSEYAPRARAVYDALPPETKTILPPLPDEARRPARDEPKPGTIRDDFVVPAAKVQAGRASL